MSSSKPSSPVIINQSRRIKPRHNKTPTEMNHFSPNPSLLTAASHSMRSNFSRVGYRYNPSMLKHVRAVGYRNESSPKQAKRIFKLAAPMAGIRSLPVMNDRIFRCAEGCVCSKKSQNHCTTGSVSGCGDGQFSYTATARSEATSNGSSEPRTRSSISSARKRESALPPQTVKNPRLKG